MATALNPRLRDGIAAAKARDFDRARTLLEAVTTASPNEPLAWFWLAIVAPSAETAIPCLRRVVQIDGGHEQAREALARLLVTQAGTAAAAGKRKDARACATEATQLMPDDDTCWLALASVSDDRAERLNALRRAHAASPQAATRTRLKRTILYYAVMAADNDRAEARTLFREAAALEPADGHVWQALVQLADTPADALSIVREFVKAAPGDPEGRALLTKALAADARALEAAGDTVAACEHWREASALDPRDIEAWVGVMTLSTDEEEVRRAIETAYEIDPSDARVEAQYSRIQVPVDPAALEPPPDAFARLAAESDVFAGLDTTPDPFAQFDLVADPFARFQRAKAPAPPAPATAPVVEVAAAEPIEEPSIEIAIEAQPEIEQPFATPAAEAAAADIEMPIEPVQRDEPGAVEPAPVAAPWIEERRPDAEWQAPESAPAAVAEPVIDELAAPAPVPVIEVPEPPAAVADLEAPAPVAAIESPAPAPACPAEAITAEREGRVIEPPAPVAVVEPAAPSAARADLAPPRDGEPVAPVAAVRVARSNGRRTVMVVDDSPTIRKILGLTLERAGYKVVAEPDGESAIERLIHVVPDVILLDIAMPKLDGYEVCRRIRKDPRTAHVPVVMLSGKDALFDKVKGHMAGASEYLTKPFEPPAVLAAVSHACEAASGVVDG